MSLYSYEKREITKTWQGWKLISILSIFSGLVLLLWVIYPILTFELTYTPRFSKLLSPVSGESYSAPVKELSAGIDVFNQEQVDFNLSSVDYTKASVWFPKAKGVALPQVETLYKLSIPKLSIENASVAIGGDDLSQSLIHFTGNLPGTYGNPVIFGHSTLPILYNPQDYKSIFSKLPDLEKDDALFITLDDVTYQYRIYEMVVVSPNDVKVLEQRYDDSYITLVTCVPPGTYFKRLVIRGRLQTT